MRDVMTELGRSVHENLVSPAMYTWLQKLSVYHVGALLILSVKSGVRRYGNQPINQRNPATSLVLP
jgi:hypothetical protein